MNKIRQMLLLQQQLNDATNGIGWENGETKNGKLIDWRRCIFLECAELIESYPWKHWKNIDAKPDYENIKIEAVDIWHFIMSEMLRIYKTAGEGDIDSLTQTIESLPNFHLFTQDISEARHDYYHEISVIEELLEVLFGNQTASLLMEKFISVAIQSHLNLNALYQLYIGKNILNQFRQDHGYKDGSYIKNWDGKEDNVVMQQILSSNLDITPDELYKALSDLYPNKILQ